MALAVPRFREKFPAEAAAVMTARVRAVMAA